ncbi:DUF4270 domain-containing protein [Pontibacter sp. 172403-2]|uniref:DUF4270 family protein n=1 Tax=Pontibacter rufus TaxID=2791028 RepID=UPI0018AFBEA3|nr:DUF4270 family protein [Pontibacter sp. 172403-2]MBF9253149.1 DUF4270 domain-containing protein [Pontibacter sp. 172403-2]
MNSAVRRLFFFFFAITALSSCEDASEIGINLQDENQIGTDFTDTLTIKTGTVLLNDSVLSYQALPVQVGQYVDPVLGTVKATAFTGLSLGGTNVKFGDNPVADSAVLTLDYTSVYGNKSAPLTLEVHRLTEGFQEKASYFTNSTLAYAPEPLGTVTFQPRFITVSRNNKDVDSAVVARVKLDPAFASELVAQSGQSTFADQASFSNFLKGIALVPAGDAAGNVVGFNLSSASTKLTLYYTSGAEQKTKVFNVTSNQPFFTNIQADRTGTVLEGLNQKGDYIPASETGGESYIQTNTQLLTKVEIPNLQQLKAQQGDIIVNRAELIFPVKNASTDALAPPPTLVLYPTDSSNRIFKNTTGTPITVQQDVAFALNSTSYTAPLEYDAKKNTYALNVTKYVQAILLGNKENNGFLLAPAVVTASTTTQGATTVTTETSPYRAIISNTGDQQVKLLLYFSKLK